jgi:16S rRNA (cytosine1402-N4)-methyltransferase
VFAQTSLRHYWEKSMSENAHPNPHTSVLVRETLDSLNLVPGATVCDCTLGAGGHTAHFLERVGPDGLVVGLDQDRSALDIVETRLESSITSGNLLVFRSKFSNIKSLVSSHHRLQNRSFDAIFADIGVSSMQIDTASRGFSFMADGPLDMRMDQSPSDSEFADAFALINFAPPQLLEKIFKDYGEEPLARKYAAKIAEVRSSVPFTSTKQFADFIKSISNFKFHSKKHPATRVFQALRIHINQELDELKSLISQSLDLLMPGGRLGIITFHSLEDRIVKESYIELSGRTAQQHLPREIPLRNLELIHMTQPRGSILKPFPLVPTAEEIQLNPRSRSAKLRVFIKSAPQEGA